MWVATLAVVGMGGFARIYHEDTKEIEQEGLGRQVAQVAIPADQRDFADELAGMQQRGIRVFASLRQMLAEMRAEIDLVCIPTGIPLHRPMAIAALEAGCNVLVEKPAAGSIQDVDAMLAAEAHSPGFCAVGYQHVYNPDYRRVKEWVCSGKLGRVRQIRAFGCWPRDPSYYGRNGWAGKLAVADTWVLDAPHNNALAHAVNAMCFMASAKEGKALQPVNVQAELYRANAIESADTVCMRVQTDEEVEVFFVVSHCTEKNVDPVYIVSGEKAELELKYNGDTTVRWSDGSEEHYAASAGERQVFANVLATIAGEAELMCPLELARAQTLCTCGSFESAPILEIPEELRRVEEDGRIVVDGMTELVMRAWREAALFSELDGAWASAGQQVDMDSYAYFPAFRPVVG
jgi:predicted dehydrogenase